MTDQYTIPLAIDPKGVLQGLDQMDQALTGITNKAKSATNSINESFVAGAKSSETFAAKMEAGAIAAKKVSDTAKAAGVDIEKAFSGENIKASGITTKVTEFITKLRDVVGKPLTLGFNLDSAKLDALNLKLKEAKGQMEGLNIVLDAAKQRLSTLQAGTQPFLALEGQINEAQKFIDVLNEDSSALVDLTKNLHDVEKPAESLETRIRRLRDRLSELELTGKRNTVEFRELLKEAGNLQNQFNDTQRAVQFLAKDTKALDAGISAVRGLAGAFAVGQGALAVFGEQNKEAALAIQKVQGALAILQGVQEVANVLNKNSALLVYLKTFAINTEIASTVAYTTALEAETVATVGATAATNTFTAALLKNPIVLVATAIAALVVGMYAFIKSQEDAKKSTEQLNKELERQKAFLAEDNAIVARRAVVAQAEAEAARKHQSEMTKIKLFQLREQQRIDREAILETEKAISQSKGTDDKDIAQRKQWAEDIEKLESGIKTREAEIRASGILRQFQLKNEENKIALDRLQEKQSAALAEIAILNQGRAYLNDITNARISELREGQKKEIAVLNEALKEKIQALNAEQAANLTKLQNDRKLLNYDLETDRKLLEQKKRDLDKQIELQIANGEKVKELQIELQNATNNEIALVNKKYADQNADIQFQAANTLLGIQEQTAKQREQIIRLSAQHEIDLIERTNQTIEQKNLQIDAIEKKRDKDILESNLEFELQRLDIEHTANETSLMQNKKFFDQSRDAQALHNYLLAENDLKNAEDKLAALIAAGKKESDQEVTNLRNTVARLKGEVEKIKKDVGPLTLAELLFPKDANSQKLFGDTMKALEEVGKAVEAYTSLIISEYQKQIDAQKKLIQKDDDALAKLQDRLKEEQDLKKNGYANNVEGIQKEIAAKNKQRDEDVKKQDEYQKKMEAVQKRNLGLQTAIQAANLLTASTNIFLAASQLSVASGGTLTAPAFITAGLTVAAMLASFIAAKVEAFNAVSTTTMEKGGRVKGKSHSQGGQKYYANDNTGGIVELEADEFVTSKKQTEKYLPLLEVINDDKLKHMDDRDLINMLHGLGIHLQDDKQHTEVLRDAKEYAAQVNQINIVNASNTPTELKSIDNTLKEMLGKTNAVPVITEENGYTVIRSGKVTKKIKKRQNMLFENFPLPLPWYSSVTLQDRFRQNVAVNNMQLQLAPKDGLLPFQFRKPVFSTIPISWKVRCAANGTLKDYMDGYEDPVIIDLSTFITSALEWMSRVDPATGDSYDYFTFKYQRNTSSLIEWDLPDGLEPGVYYMELDFGPGAFEIPETGGKWVSETFRVPNETFIWNQPNEDCNYPALKWSHNSDIAPIHYNADDEEPFFNIVFLDTFITASEPEIEIEGENDGFNEFHPKFQKAIIKYRISAMVPDYLKIAIYSALLHENKYLFTEKSLREGQIKNMEVTSSLTSDGALSIVEIIFEQMSLFVTTGCEKNMEAPEPYEIEGGPFTLTAHACAITGLVRLHLDSMPAGYYGELWGNIGTDPMVLLKTYISRVELLAGVDVIVGPPANYTSYKIVIRTFEFAVTESTTTSTIFDLC